MRIVYSILLALALPLIVARLFWRSFKLRGYRENIAERFARYQQPSTHGCIWIHAVSVGETRAALPLIRRLKLRYPARQILLTGMTPTGRATAQELFDDVVTSVYLPYDFVALHQRLIDQFRPSILLIMETEIWPNLLAACQQNAIPALIVNARLSEKSLRRYSRVAAARALVQEALQSMRVVVAQSVDDAERFRILGALSADKIVVTGNIKFDVVTEPAQIARGGQWRAAQPHRHVLLCASTREGEEALLLAAYMRVFDAEARRNTLLVLVPRHPQRFDEVAGEIKDAGLRCVRRSLGMAGIDTCDVLLGDSMGEMAAYYSLCDIAIIGGSFLPLGGQNLIEACALGKPVIMGPSIFNFASTVRLAADAGAMEQVSDAPEAMHVAHQLLRDDVRRKNMSEAGFKLIGANRGATEKTLAQIVSVLGEK